MNRRDFLLAGAGLALAGCMRRGSTLRRGSVMTVRGPIFPDAMGIALPHEHILVDFASAPADARSCASSCAGQMGCYECDEVFHLVLPHLEEIRDLGVRTLMDTTPKYLGRDVRLLRRLSEASGLHIITNTGYYGALNDHHLPEHAFSETAEEIARRWIQEWTDGIDDTGIRPGMMKIGVDAGTLSEMDAKLVRAAAITHLQTGLTIAAHGGSAVAAFGELEVLEEEGVHPSAWIWVHAQAEEDIARHVEAARLGAWVEFDGISPESVNRHVDLVDNMRRHNLLDRTLISQDAGWYTVGEPGGGTFRRYSTLLTEFIPALRHAGLEDGEIDHLVTKNPAEAFRIRERSVRR